MDAAYSTVRNYITGLKELGIIKEGEKVGRRQFYEFDMAGARNLWIAIMIHYSEKLLYHRVIVTEELKDNYPIEKVEGLIPPSNLPSYSYGDLDDVTSRIKTDSAKKISESYENEEGIATFLDLWIETYLDNVETSTFYDMLINDMWDSLQNQRRLDRFSSGEKEKIIENANLEEGIFLEDTRGDEYDIDSAISELKKTSFPEKLEPVYEILELITGESKSFALDDALESVWFATLTEEYDIKSGFEIERKFRKSEEGNSLTKDLVEDMYRYLSRKEENPEKELKAELDRREDLDKDEKEKFKSQVESLAGN